MIRNGVIASADHQIKQTPLIVWVVTGSIAANVIGSSLFSEFAEISKTEDWVLEHRTWITCGVGFIAAVIFCGFVLFGLRRRNKTNT